MRFSIITVCLNAQESIVKTIQSVLEQEYDNFEYIIMDGKSTDETLNIVKTFDDKRIRCYSEKDTGIYNAMNKSVLLARGDYVLFLNSGDYLNNNQVLSRTVAFLEENPVDIAYGNIELDGLDVKKKIKYYQKHRKITKYYLLYRTICHQAIFAKRALLLDEKLDESYIYWADQEWLIRCITTNKVIKSMNLTICNYNVEGVSSDKANIKYIQKESDRILKQYMPFFWKVLYPFKRVKRLLL